METDEQLCIHLQGVVQGVGMRYYVRDLAHKMGLHGYVQNTADGRVKCVVRGEKSRLALFVDSLKTAPRGRVDHVEVEKCSDKEEFSHFNIRF